MKKLRNLLVAAPIAGVLAITGLAAGTQTADALVTAADNCKEIGRASRRERV